jgi:hypothetical protein
LEGSRQLDCLGPVACLTAHLEAGVLEERSQVETDDGLVLGDENPHVVTRSLQSCIPHIAISSLG